MINYTKEPDLSTDSSNLNSEIGLGSEADNTETYNRYYMTFVIETENLESAYCFGLDMLEYLIEKSKQSYSYSY